MGLVHRLFGGGQPPGEEGLSPFLGVSPPGRLAKNTESPGWPAPGLPRD